MWAVHGGNAMTPGKLVASILALKVREARHIARTSSVNLHTCMRVCSYAKQRACIGALETSARPKTDRQEVPGVDREVVRTHVLAHCIE